MNRTKYKEFRARYRHILKIYDESKTEIERDKQRQQMEQLAKDMNLNIISSVTNTKAFFWELSERISMAFDRYETLKASQGAFWAAVAAAVAAIFSGVCTFLSLIG
ncbi:MAG TPA: hypothetical protein VMW16_08095 [Sedimentisphaerales bacterium]|nr:hypothetical protein [Sedimentisphaerales bacterium]